MENLCKRFPHLAERIFDQVDDQSLSNCKEISGEVLEYLDSERFFWIRLIKRYGLNPYRRRLKDFPKLWKPVIDKTPVERVKQIAIATSRFFRARNLYSDQLRFYTVPGRKWSLIAIAAHHGDLGLLQFIVNKIKLKNFRQTEKNNALFLAASEGHLDIYDFLSRKLRDKNPGKISLLNRLGRTPLHWAAMYGHIEVCKLILEGTSNKNPAEIKYPRQTPLHCAAYYGHSEVCKLIMDSINVVKIGFDKNPASEYKGETPFHFAAKQGQLAVCQLMLEKLSDKNPATNATGLTPLHYAAESGHVEVCKLIMENLVDKNPFCLNMSTPLSRATNRGQSEVCQLFRENGYSNDDLLVKERNL